MFHYTKHKCDLHAYLPITVLIIINFYLPIHKLLACYTYAHHIHIVLNKIKLYI